MKPQEKPRVVIIVQARIGATRLPGKPLREVMDRPLLGYLVERLRRCTKADEIVIATTTNPQDQQIVDYCHWEQIPLFRGSEQDVLDRYVKAAHSFAADVVVRITADCPLIDPQVVDKTIGYFLDHYPDYDYVSNMLTKGYPRGMDVEVFSMKALQDADLNGVHPEEREHVTLYMYRHPELFRVGHVELGRDESHHRWTVDTEEDFQLVAKILEALYPVYPTFTFEDIILLLSKHPDWVAINSHIEQKRLSNPFS